MPVHDVYMDDTAAAFRRGAHLLTEAGKIRRKNRRCQLDQNLVSLEPGALVRMPLAEILTRTDRRLFRDEGASHAFSEAGRAALTPRWFERNWERSGRGTCAPAPLPRFLLRSNGCDRPRLR